jgi:protein TonB
MQTAIQHPQLASPSDRDMRIALALMASFALHGIAMSTQFTLVNPKHFEDMTTPMEVVLVNARTREAPLKPDVLAQHDLAGGGNVDEERQAKSPLPFKSKASELTEESAQARVKQLEEQARQLLTQLKSQSAVETVTQPSPRREVSSSDLMLQASEAAKLQARISRDYDEYQKRPRREFVGANAKSYVFARYVEDWVAKVERIGNLNYPDAARRQGVYGSLRLSVSIFADGRVEKIEIDKSSGSKLLDQAAIRIVDMAAPYAAFSKEMKEKADILSITRTWTFTRSDQLESTE